MVDLYDRPSPEEPDLALAEIAYEIKQWDPAGERLGKVFRRTYDQLYDGQHTGRYSVDQLFKTEKTHFGTLIEINMQREFRIQDGEVLDYKIAGHEVDCKFSHTGKWMLPIESFDQLVMVTQADDQKSKWSVGIIRVTQENRRSSENRDRKTGLNAYGRSQISWLHKEVTMQPNALLQLPPDLVDEIMSQRSGQSRVNELLSRVTNTRLTRNIIATVAQQDDYMKRVRANGGARTALQPAGYLILSGDYSIQRSIAINLGAAVPIPGEIVSVRVVPADFHNGTDIAGSWWRLADYAEIAMDAAPTLPEK